jgi:hypothetical protein
MENINALALRGTNDGPRPVKLSMAYLMTDDGRQVVSPCTRHSDELPKMLIEGESAQVFWTQSKLDELRSREGCD